MTYAAVTFLPIRHNSKFPPVRIEYLYSQTCKHIAVSVAETQIPKALEPDGPQHEHGRLCYRPAVFYCHALLNAFCFPQQNNSARFLKFYFNVFVPLNAELNPICHLLALLGTHHILHVHRIRVNFTR